MNGWLLDTNVVSELRKTQPNRGVKAWSDAQPADSFFLSTVTFAEIRFGIERQPDPMLCEELETWLAHRLRPWFEGRILQPDLFIAATAQVHSLTLCTRNERDFREADIPILNPWSG